MTACAAAKTDVRSASRTARSKSRGIRSGVASRASGAAPLKVNDLHTAALTAELARVTGASAIINTAADRNDVDLNRVSAAHDRAPWFLERLADVLAATLGRHGHATLLTVHGWN